ncbi:MAG: SDR family oxidoreductase [Chloroflexota bacterium]|nr:SDR family oxidoreductase [Chloroflexota bacterium]
MRHILITGASRGIGLEFARQYLTRGERVFAACRRPDAAPKLHALAALAPDRLHIVPLDVTDQASIDASYAVVRQHTDRLHVLINNAGVLLEDEKTPDNLAALDFARVGQVFATNALGAVMVARRYIELLKRSIDMESDIPSKIVNITSGYGSIQLHTHNDTYAYAASKAALNMFTRILAHDALTRGMAVIALDPGWVRTDMGTDAAELAPAESVGGMLRVIDALTAADKGVFLRWDGVNVPW